MFNRNNEHVWAEEQPHSFRVRNNQRRWGFYVWVGLMGNKIIGPHIYEENLNGPRYLDFLENEIINYLEYLNLNERQNMWFQQDGAPAHNTRPVYERLQDMFEDRWIATNGPFKWPARSPDLTPLDFFLWGYLKNKVYSTPVTTKENLMDRVRDACATLTPEEINNATSESVLKRFELCLERNGNQIEHYL